MPALGDFEYNMNFANFYHLYSALKNKPFSVSECAAAFHPQAAVGPGELAIKQAWWRQTFSNVTFFATYPNIKLMALFEFEKVEDDGVLGTDLRDFRVSWNTAVRKAFVADLVASSAQIGYVNGNLTIAYSANKSSNGPTSGSNSVVRNGFRSLISILYLFI